MIGDDWAKAGQELGKAQQEIAKAAGKGIDAAGATGSFFAKYLAGPFEQASLIVTDRLKYRRLEQAVRFEQKAKDLLRAANVGDTIKPLPLSFGVPLIEAATLEDDDDLQTVWAHLLTNAATGSSDTSPRRAFVSILSDMTALDAKILAMIGGAPPDMIDEYGYVWTGDLPDGYLTPSRSAATPEPTEEVKLSLWNLNRLGCIQLPGVWEDTTCNLARPTTLGQQFVVAVSPRGGA